jgi:hypothetical protein
MADRCPTIKAAGEIYANPIRGFLTRGSPSNKLETNGYLERFVWMTVSLAILAWRPMILTAIPRHSREIASDLGFKRGLCFEA